MRGQPGQIRLPVNPGNPVDEEFSTYYWYPDRFGVEKAPERFRKRLKEIHPSLDCTWHPLRQRWQVWYRKPHLNYKLCPGWAMILQVENSQGEYVPLDERVLAAVYEQSAFKWGNGKRYFERVISEYDRDKMRRDAAHQQSVNDRSTDYWDHMQIKNIGAGNKFATHWS